MVCTCSVKGCSNFARSGSGISFHKFPSDPAVCEQWLKAIKRENFKPSEFSKICSAHFNREDFNINFGSKKLKPNAIPSIFQTSTNSHKPSINTLRKDITEKRNKEKTCEDKSIESSTKKNVVLNSKIRFRKSSSPIRITYFNNRKCEAPESVGSILEDNVSISTQQPEEPNPPINITSITDRLSLKNNTSNITNTVQKNVVIPIQSDSKSSTPITITAGIEGTREALVSVGNNLHKYVMIPMQLDEKLSAPVPLGTTSGVELSEGTTLKKYVMMPLQTVNGLMTQPIANSTIPVNNSSPKKRKRQIARFIEDISESDFRDAKQFKYMWEVATKTVKKQRKTIKYLRAKLYRLQKRLDKLNNYSIRIIIDE